MIYSIASWGLVIMAVIAVCAIVFYVILLLGRKEINKELQLKLQQLELIKSNLASDLKKLEETKLNHALKVANDTMQVNKLKDEVIKKYDEVLSSMKEAEFIRTNTQEKLDTLQKQINQLHSDLFHARKRAERLAKRNQAAV